MRVYDIRRSKTLSAGFRLFTIGILTVSLLMATVGVAPVSAASGTPVRLASGGPETSFLPTQFVDMGGFAYFLQYDATYGVALWKSDGTVSGTTFVKDLTEISSNISLTNVGGLLYITGAATGNNDGDLWESDGTAEGTVLLKSGLSFTSIERFQPVALNGALYFGVSELATDTTELWTSDGTAAGTVKVMDLGRSLGKMVVMNGNMYFPNPTNAPNHPGYWKSDGTVAGTSLIRVEDSFPTIVDASTTLGNFTVVDDELFYWINGDVSSVLVKTSGNPQSDTIVKEDLKSSREAVAVNGILYFFGWTYDDDPNAIIDAGLWKSDGTAAGTELITSSFYNTTPQELQPTMGEISSFTNYGGQLMIFALKIDYDVEYGNPNGMEVWKSDGTTAGTTKIKEILSPSPADSGVRAQLGGLLYFAANTDDEGYELWETDGTTAGTEVIDLNPGPSYGYPGGLSIVNSKLFFWAFDDTEGFRPWALTNI